MIKSGVAANTVTYNSVINACAKAGQLHRAEEWLEKLVSQAAGGPPGLCDEKVAPDVISYNTVVTAHAKAGDVQKAESWAERMAADGQMPNLVTYLALMQAHSRAGRPKDVERLLNQMMARRVRPDVRCLSALMLAYVHASPSEPGHPGQAAAAFQRFVERGVPWDAVAAVAKSRAAGRRVAAVLVSKLEGKEEPLNGKKEPEAKDPKDEPKSQ